MKHVALLRAVNVGGRKLAMADARSVCVALGFIGVTSLLQSGNLVFEAGRFRGARLETTLEEAALSRLGLALQFVVRSRNEWEDAVDANPLARQAAEDPARTHMMSLKDAVRPAALTALKRWIPGREVVAAVGRQLYVYYPDGAGRSVLTLSAIEKRLGTRGTARNWNTALKILAALKSS